MLTQPHNPAYITLCSIGVSSVKELPIFIFWKSSTMLSSTLCLYRTLLVASHEDYDFLFFSKKTINRKETAVVEFWFYLLHFAISSLLISWKKFANGAGGRRDAGFEFEWPVLPDPAFPPELYRWRRGRRYIRPAGSIWKRTNNKKEYSKSE